MASQNLRSGNPDPAATVGALTAADVDLIGLQEVDDDDRVDAALRQRYPHRAAVSTVALWSRWPIRDSVGVDTGLGWDRALRAVVAAPQGDLVVYVVHLGSARAGHTATRDETLAALATAVRADPAPRLVVLGDLNTATTDRVFVPLPGCCTTPRPRPVRASVSPGRRSCRWPAPTMCSTGGSPPPRRACCTPRTATTGR